MKEQFFAQPDNGDVDQAWALLAVCWAFVTCALVSTILRVWVRARLTRNLGSDDYNMMIAMVSNLVYFDRSSRCYKATSIADHANRPPH